MAYSGDLSSTSIDKVLQMVLIGEQSGSLTVEGPELALFWFNEGVLGYACIGGSTSAKLVDTLVESGLLSSSQKSIVDQSITSTGDKHEANSIVAHGFLARPALEMAIEKHYREIVRAVLEWDAGKFQFDPFVALPDYRIKVSIPLSEFVAVPD